MPMWGIWTIVIGDAQWIYQNHCRKLSVKDPNINQCFNIQTSEFLLPKDKLNRNIFIATRPLSHQKHFHCYTIHIISINISLPQDQYILLYDIPPRRPCCWFLFLFRFLIPSTEQRPRTRRRTTTCSKMMSKINCLNLDRYIYIACIMVSIILFQTPQRRTNLHWTQLTRRNPTWEKDTLLERKTTRKNLSWKKATLLERRKLNLELN